MGSDQEDRDRNTAPRVFRVRLRVRRGACQHADCGDTEARYRRGRPTLYPELRRAQYADVCIGTSLPRALRVISVRDLSWSAAGSSPGRRLL